MIDGYSLILASYVGKRDGMALELTRDGGAVVAEVFEDDSTHVRTVSMFEAEVPLEAMEWLISSSKVSL